MKTTKAKTNTKPKKTSSAGNPIKEKIVSRVKYLPGDDEIREKAREIYYGRITRGEHGTAETDWHEAEQLLKG